MSEYEEEKDKKQSMPNEIGKIDATAEEIAEAIFAAADGVEDDYTKSDDEDKRSKTAQNCENVG